MEYYAHIIMMTGAENFRSLCHHQRSKKSRDYGYNWCRNMRRRNRRFFLLRRDKQAPNDSTAALCACSFTNAHPMISVFPYAGYMVMDLMEDRVTQDNVTAYAGPRIACCSWPKKCSAPMRGGRLLTCTEGTFVLKANLLLSVPFPCSFCNG